MKGTTVVAREVGGAVTVHRNDFPVLTYHYGDGELYPYCHPVHLPAGPPITVQRPFDHVWHLGMYLAWKYINGVNVWEGPHSGEPWGKTRHVAATIVSDEELGSGVSHVIEWTDSDDLPLLRDHRTILVRPNESSKYHVIDWSFEFQAIVDEVKLDRKVEWGGYAGLGVRLPRSFIDPRVLNAEGQQEAAETNAACSRWTDYSGWIDGQPSKTWAGVTMIDHPDNARFPTPWLTYATHDLQYLNAAFLRDAPYTLRRGETLQLAYRVLVHWDDGDTRLIEDEANRFGEMAPHDEATRLLGQTGVGEASGTGTIRVKSDEGAEECD